MSAEKAVNGWLRRLFGHRPDAGGYVIFFSARLDETGTDGRSPYVIVAGGVSTVEYWDKLERSWSALLARRGVAAFHTKEFMDRVDDFAGWGDIKCRNFVKAQEKIIQNNVGFQIAVAVERNTHRRIKEQWRGVRGFKGDSDYGLCFRVCRALICDKVAKFFSPTDKVQFIVEDGPFAADASIIYQDIKRTHGAKYRPARHAGMMAGFASVPKGTLRSLEAADYLAGRAIADLATGSFISTKRKQQISVLMDEEFLNRWNEGMAKERERRQAFGKRTKRAS